MAYYEDERAQESQRSWNPYQSAVAQSATRSTFLNGVYQHMAIGLGITGLVAMAASNSPAAIGMVIQHPIILAIAQVGMVLGLTGLINRISTPVAIGLFYGYAALTGLTMSLLFLIYTSQSIASTFFITGATFGAMSVYGYTTKRDMSGLGNFFMMGLIGLIIASVANMWLQSPMIVWVTSCIGVLLFVGLTAYDTQRIKQMAYQLGDDEHAGRIAILGALTLYLDFINLFIYLLRLMGSRRRD